MAVLLRCRWTRGQRRAPELVDLRGERVHDRLHVRLRRLRVRANVLPRRVHGVRDDLAFVGARLADPFASVPADVLDHLLDHQLRLAEHLDDLFVHAAARLLVMVELGLYALQFRPAALQVRLEPLVLGPELVEFPLGGLDLVSQQIEVPVDLARVEPA